MRKPLSNTIDTTGKDSEELKGFLDGADKSVVTEYAMP